MRSDLRLVLSDRAVADEGDRQDVRDVFLPAGDVRHQGAARFAARVGEDQKQVFALGQQIVERKLPTVERLEFETRCTSVGWQADVRLLLCAPVARSDSQLRLKRLKAQQKT